MDFTLVLMLIGFIIASYSIVANDAIQTLGTFLSSNSHRPWWILWIYISSIFTAVLIYGWIVNGGDVSYGRLDKFPVPDNFSWFLIVPPIAILILTRYGVPVSTTFLVLTVFASTNLEKMLVKSIMGYIVAFGVSIFIYLLISKIVEDYFIKTKPHDDLTLPLHWVVLQWLSTGFLWTQWLIQDLANIFVYMPNRELSFEYLFGALILLWFLHGYIFYTRGGAIQKIVTSKTNTTDIRSATIIDFMFGLILLFFKEWNSVPMSTTWVFLGLLAGRELAMSLSLHHRTVKSTFKVISSDIAKAFLGLAVSLIIAFTFPLIG